MASASWVAGVVYIATPAAFAADRSMLVVELLCVMTVLRVGAARAKSWAVSVVWELMRRAVAEPCQVEARGEEGRMGRISSGEECRRVRAVGWMGARRKTFALDIFEVVSFG